MFPKKQRISKTKDIEAVFKGKISAYNKLFGLKAIKNTLYYNRYTVIISTKVSKLAVERNRIKRNIKNTLKKHDSQIKPGIDCIVIVLKEANKAKVSEIDGGIENLLKRTYLM